MAVQQLGNRLARSFGNYRVVTEVIDGKTFTNVFNKQGELVKQRVKAFSEQMVGDKFIKTKTCVTKNKAKFKHKSITDRVYNDLANVKKYLGFRKSYYSEVNDKFYSDLIEKGSVDVGGTMTTPRSNGTRAERLVIDKNNFVKAKISYNNKGLPYPSGEEVPGLENSSLAEMRKWLLDNCNKAHYAPDSWNMPSLNDPANIGHKLNSLDCFL